MNSSRIRVTLTSIMSSLLNSVMLSGVGVQRSGTPAKSKHPYFSNGHISHLSFASVLSFAVA